MAELVFFTGTMDCGKSTLALQTDHTHRSHGRIGQLFTSHDRAGEGVLSSRLGFEVSAVVVDAALNFWHIVVDELTQGSQIEYLVCDEAQFYTRDQIEQLARVADELSIDVFNLLHLLDSDWGLVRGIEGTGLLRLVGYDAGLGRGIYTLQIPRRQALDVDASRWRMHLGARYSF